MVLAEARIRAQAAAGIDQDHQPVDAIRYVAVGKPEIGVRELRGYGLAALVAGPDPMMLLGKDFLPSQVLYSGLVPAPDEPMGMLSTATSDKPELSAFGGPAWYRCISADGWTYGITDRHVQQVGLRPGVLELTFLRVDVPDGSHLGCGEATTVIAIPLSPDRIYAPIFTVRGGEIEGSTVSTTSGMHRDEYSATVATAVGKAAIVVAWVSEGYVLGAVSRNWGTKFEAPSLLAEAGQDGSRISAVKLMGIGNRLVAAFARETCQPQCTTQFELLVSEDDAKSWHPL